jgi:hypothetical protein
VREGLAPAVAGRRHAHQAGVQPVLHVAAQDAVLDQHGAAGGVPSSSTVSEPRRSGRVPSSTTVTPGGHPLADAAGEGRGALAVEVALQAVADGLVQQDAGPAGPSTTVISPAGAGRRRG